LFQRKKLSKKLYNFDEQLIPGKYAFAQQISETEKNMGALKIFFFLGFLMI